MTVKEFLENARATLPKGEKAGEVEPWDLFDAVCDLMEADEVEMTLRELLTWIMKGNGIVEDGEIRCFCVGRIVGMRNRKSKSKAKTN